MLKLYIWPSNPASIKGTMKQISSINTWKQIFFMLNFTLRSSPVLRCYGLFEFLKSPTTILFWAYWTPFISSASLLFYSSPYAHIALCVYIAPHFRLCLFNLAVIPTLPSLFFNLALISALFTCLFILPLYHSPIAIVLAETPEHNAHIRMYVWRVNKKACKIH